MSRPTRNKDNRKRVYKPANLLDIPEEVTKHFKNQGFSLRWVRVELAGQDDASSVSKRVREGYQFVTKTEIPEDYRDFFGDTRKVRASSAVVCINELVLAKIETDAAEARQEHYEEKSSEAVRSFERFARKGRNANEDPMLQKYVPLTDNSSLTVEVK
jgi:DNA-binding transcriptional MerR regulator